MSRRLVLQMQLSLDGFVGGPRGSGDLATEIAMLKRQPGKDLLAHGGARFARSLVRTGLIDEFRLMVHPLVLEKGCGAVSRARSADALQARGLEGVPDRPHRPDLPTRVKRTPQGDSHGQTRSAF
jgi:riboflavin biosynthesis pyrimidine reductase